MPAQPYDWWHVQGAGGLTIINAREAGESAGAVGGGAAAQCFPNMLLARPIFVGDDGLLLSRLGVNLGINTAPGSVRFGLYECPAPEAHNMYPQGLVEDFGAVALNGSYRPSLAVSRRLAPGFHYLATIFSDYAFAWGQVNMGGGGLPLGYHPSTGIGFVAFAVQQNFGALPATFPTLATAAFGMTGPAAPVAGSPAFYCEAIDVDTRVAAVTYNVAIPAGTAVVVTDTAVNVTVQYGTNTLGSVAAAALAGSANLASAVLTTADALLPNAGSMSATLLPQGPIQGTLTGSSRYAALVTVDVTV